MAALMATVSIVRPSPLAPKEVTSHGFVGYGGGGGGGGGDGAPDGRPLMHLLPCFCAVGAVGNSLQDRPLL